MENRKAGGINMTSEKNSEGFFTTLATIVKVVSFLLFLVITVLAGAAMLFYNLWQRERSEAETQEAESEE